MHPNARSSATPAEMQDRLRKLTRSDNPPEQRLLRNRGALVQAILSGVVNWEIKYPSKGYSGKIEEGEILSCKERRDVVQEVYHSLRGLVW